VESTDIFARTGFAEVTFAVDTTAASNDDTNPYCIGEAAYPVGPSSFTTGISVPTADNAILIASPTDQATINSTNIIVKGAMDTTVPVYSVLVVVSGNTGTAGYLAQVNGNYFAAKVQVSSDTKTITAIATDQTGTQHQASVSVSPMIQSSAVDLTALPDIGIPTPKQSGPAMFNSILSSAAITNQVASYAWDFAGNGIADLTCVTHATVTASYQQPGLYFAQVTITDTMGSTFTDTTIVNVLARETLDNIFKPEWNAIKAALNNNDITTAINHVAGSSQYIFQQQFNALALAQALPQFAASLSDISLANVSANFADYEFRTMQNGITYSFQVLFTRDTDGVWRIKSF
jgi:hypothetical protein